jgi:hypothetical protein
MERFHRIGYWYWLALGMLLAIAHLGISPLALPAAIGLGLVQCIHFLICHRRLSAFPVQVRLAYLGALVSGQIAGGLTVTGLLIGTATLLLFDYCPLARMLWLMPWNRTRPITLGVMWWAFTSRPASFLAALPGERGTSSPQHV